MLNNLKISFLTKKILFRKFRYEILTTSVTHKTFETDKLFLLLI